VQLHTDHPLPRVASLLPQYATLNTVQVR
jgi:hypothetical protein